ncbi:hypothetical protein DSO57_1019649 [Entomophthora muscae]|uniref:Uncharacterized protein n=1 Tax=Entomophthora muscae TaxID=34485 RepID=A0ACC2UDZ5_9FUNG|nr:hypothetical protein DSO57_1019649 [Entomophthora muscae]
MVVDLVQGFNLEVVSEGPQEILAGVAMVSAPKAKGVAMGEAPVVAIGQKVAMEETLVLAVAMAIVQKVAMVETLVLAVAMAIVQKVAMEEVPMAVLVIALKATGVATEEAPVVAIAEAQVVLAEAMENALKAKVAAMGEVPVAVLVIALKAKGVAMGEAPVVAIGQKVAMEETLVLAEAMAIVQKVAMVETLVLAEATANATRVEEGQAAMEEALVLVEATEKILEAVTATLKIAAMADLKNPHPVLILVPSKKLANSHLLVPSPNPLGNSLRLKVKHQSLLSETTGNQVLQMLCPLVIVGKLGLALATLVAMIDKAGRSLFVL